MKSNLELDRVRHRINNMFESTDSGVDFLKMSDKLRDPDSRKSSVQHVKSQVSFSSSVQSSTDSSEPESDFRRSSIWSRCGHDLGRLSNDWCFIDCK